MSGALLASLALLFAAMAGFCSWRAWEERIWMSRMRQHVLSMGSSSCADAGHRDSLIAAMERLTRLLEHGQARELCPERAAKSPWFAECALRSGVSSTVSEQAFCEMRFRMLMLLGVIGGVVGYVFSAQLALLLAAVGAAVGWRLPASAVRRRQEERARIMEGHLPEMLDVLALGMGSGLSFDAALRLYCTHFQTESAADLQRAQSSWSAGLEKREDALRRFAQSYDSATLARVTETWIRSLRFGTSMVESLGAEGAQARAAYKATREERIAKAPVKMMVPTGTLILPAMLVLVLGPVLLELMNGGF